MVSFASCNFMPSVHFGHSWSWWDSSLQHHSISRPKKVTTWCIVSFHSAFVACWLNKVLRKCNCIMDRRTSIDFASDKLAVFLGFSLVDTCCADLLTRSEYVHDTADASPPLGLLKWFLIDFCMVARFLFILRNASLAFHFVFSRLWKVNAMQCSTKQCNAVERNAVQCNATPCNGHAMQCKAKQSIWFVEQAGAIDLDCIFGRKAMDTIAVFLQRRCLFLWFRLRVAISCRRCTSGTVEVDENYRSSIMVCFASKRLWYGA